MLKIGCHLSSSKGFLAMGETAIEIGANTFQFFTRNPRGGNAKPLDLQDIDRYLIYAKEHNIDTILAHAPYTLNACAEKEDLRDFAFRTMQDDLKRLSYLPDAMYNFHPGSHVGQGEERGIELISELLNRILEEDFRTTVLLETMAGKGSEVGRSFEELRRIIDKVEKNSQLGVCLDTCHVYDGGYDIVNHLDHVLEEFDKMIGLDRLKAIHLNDSMNPIGSHKDRHAKIGAGSIGQEAFAGIINHAKLKELPFYLETPNELPGYQKEIELLKSLYQG
ncbi:MAG: deoxyribonuclease IV [Lachnospiraceae bacterium]|nr:deoxyribonuclease IV [Lachnospiraceae bacterium]